MHQKLGENTASGGNLTLPAHANSSIKAWETPKRRMDTFWLHLAVLLFQQQHHPSPVTSCLPSSSPMRSSFQVQQSSINLIHSPTPSSGQSQPRLRNRKPADRRPAAPQTSLAAAASSCQLLLARFSSRQQQLRWPIECLSRAEEGN